MNNKLKKIAFKVAAAGMLGLGIGGGLAADFNASSALVTTATAPVIVVPQPSAATAAPAANTPPTSDIGPATIPQLEGLNTRYQDDLDASIPGTGIALGGDSKPGPVQINLPGKYNGDNPLHVPDNTRPLPTGTAIGPHGEHYAFYGIVPRIPNFGYIVPDTAVVNLAHPEKPLFTLKGVSQASGAYDAQSGRMIILGNTKDGHRALWQSDPISQNPDWQKTLQPLGTFSGPMDGNRESQIVALPAGSFLVVGVADGLPVEAVTASTPQGLLTAKPTAVVTPQTLPQVYGPTILDIQEINGKQVVTMRVSTYGIPGPPGIDKYDPHTYKTTFTVTPPRV